MVDSGDAAGGAGAVAFEAVALGVSRVSKFDWAPSVERDVPSKMSRTLLWSVVGATRGGAGSAAGRPTGSGSGALVSACAVGTSGSASLPVTEEVAEPGT